MTNPTESLAAWNQAAYDAAMNYARASLASAEQLLKLNLETTRASLDQAAKATRELMTVDGARELALLPWARRRAGPGPWPRCWRSSRRSPPPRSSRGT